MAKIGLEIKIDVTKIEKARLYKGAKGTYLTMTTFVDLDNQDQYGNNGMVTHSKEKDETGDTPILGNSKIFWRSQEQAQSYASQQSQESMSSSIDDLEDQDIPFS